MLMAWTIMMGMCLSMHAQDEGYSIPVNFKGERPTITDFVSALLSQEELGEYFGNLSDQWKLRQQSKKTKGTWTVNTANGYVRYEESTWWTEYATKTRASYATGTVLTIDTNSLPPV